MLTKLRQWVELAVVIAIGLFLLFHFVISPKVPTFTLPGMPATKIDTREFQQGLQKILKGMEEQNKQINVLESEVRQLQNKTVSQDIPQALKETDVRRSMERLKEVW